MEIIFKIALLVLLLFANFFIWTKVFCEKELVVAVPQKEVFVPVKKKVVLQPQSVVEKSVEM